MSALEEKVREEIALRKRASLKRYVCKVFKQSSVTAVSSILSTADNRRKAFKIIVLLVCLTGFLYQCITFLGYALQYPTNVDIEIQKPEFLEVPAYTFCNANGIVKRKYCAKYPDHCILANEYNCTRYPKYCIVNETLIPKEKYYYVDSKMKLEDVTELGQELKEFLIYFYYLNKRLGREDIVGPFTRIKGYSSGTYLKCYSANALVDSPKDAMMTRKQKRDKYPINRFKFNLQPEEILVPGDRPGLLFAVHSPFIAVNPFSRGIFMKAGRMYKIYVRMEQEILLPYPYRTNCLNYTEEWLKRNKTGPRSKEMCIEKCLREFFMSCFNCTPLSILYPNEDTRCGYGGRQRGNCSLSETEFYMCITACKNDCLRSQYILDVQERYEREKKHSNVTMEESGRIMVEIYLDDTEIIRLQHKPQYRSVEIFSYIGGFIGVWLGISLIEVMDLLEALWRTFTYVFRKRNQG